MVVVSKLSDPSPHNLVLCTLATFQRRPRHDTDIHDIRIDVASNKVLSES